MSVLFGLHVLAAVVWVGGMLAAVAAVRPAAEALEPAAKLQLWSGILSRFFALVWVAILLLLGTGFAMVFGVFQGFAHAPIHVHIMTGLGILMMLAFFHLFFAPWKRLRRAQAAGDLAAAARNLGQIRLIVTINTVLGVLVVLIAALGRFAGAGA